MQKNSQAIVLAIACYVGLLSPLRVLADPIKLEEGTPVKLKLLDSISSGSNHEGDRISFEVVDDVLAPNDKTVLIKAGTPACGSISSLEEKGCLGGKGRLSLAIESTKAINGKRVPLRASINSQGKEKAGTVIALSLFVSPLFLLMHGKDATITAGTQINTYVDRDLIVELTPADSTTTAVVTAPSALNVSATVIPPSTEAAAHTDVQTSSVKSAEEETDASKALNKLYEAGLLTKKEYETKKKALARKSIAMKK